MTMLNKRLLAVLGLSSVLLYGCGTPKEIKEEYEAIKQDKDVLNYYEDDKLLPFIYEDKDGEELTKEIIDEMLGLQSKEAIIPEYGVQKDQGIFIDFGMLNPGYIPTVTYKAIGDAVDQDNALDEEDRRQQVLDTMANLLTASDTSSKADEGGNDLTEIQEQIAYRQSMVGKEKDMRDLNLWTYTSGIETKYKDELKSLRDAIRKSREIEKAKESLRKAQLDNKSAEDAEKLNKQQQEMEEEHADLLETLSEKEQSLQEKLQKDTEFTEEEKTGKVDGLTKELEKGPTDKSGKK